MTDSYVFTRVPYRDFDHPPLRLISDPFLSLTPGEQPLYSYQPEHAISLEIADLNPNSALDRARGAHFDAGDAFFIRTNGRRYSIDAETGFRILHYFNDPTLLREKQAVRVLTVEQTPHAPPLPAQSLPPLFTQAEQREIENATSLFLQTQEVDLCFLQGACTYTQTEFESRRGFNLDGLVLHPFRDFRGPRVASSMGLTSVGFLGLLAGLESFFSAAFSWTGAVLGFLIRAGSYASDDSLTASLDSNYASGVQSTTSPAQRRRANFSMDRSLLEHEENRVNWDLTAILVSLIFLDDKVRNFTFPLRNIPRNLAQFYSPRVNNYRGALGASPFSTLGLTFTVGLSANEIYRDLLAGSHLFDYESDANRYLSGALGTYTSTLMVAKASQEIAAITGTRNLWQGLQLLARANPQFTFQVSRVPFQSMGYTLFRVPNPSIVTLGTRAVATTALESGVVAAETELAATTALAEGAAITEGGELAVAGGLAFGTVAVVAVLAIAAIGVGIYYLCED